MCRKHVFQGGQLGRPWQEVLYRELLHVIVSMLDSVAGHGKRCCRYPIRKKVTPWIYVLLVHCVYSAAVHLMLFISKKLHACPVYVPGQYDPGHRVEKASDGLL